MIETLPSIKNVAALIRKMLTPSLLIRTLLLTLVFLVIIQILKINFAWVDDTWDMRVSRKILGLLGNFDIGSLYESLIDENEAGRLRPIYILWRALVYFLAGHNPVMHYLFHSLVIVGTILLIYKTVYFFTKSDLGSLVASAVYLLIPLNSENWIRLSPAEPLSGLLMIAALYTLFRYRDASISFALLLGAILTKETTMAVVPALGGLLFIGYLQRKKDITLIRIFSLSTATLFIWMIIAFSIRKGYSTFYEFNILESLYRFKVYLILFYRAFSAGAIFLITFIARNIYLWLKKKKIDNINIIQFFFLMLFFSLLAFHSPWIWVLERYMLPATICGAVFIGLEIANLFNIFRLKFGKFSALIKLLGLVVIGLYMIYGITKVGGVIVKAQQNTQSIQALLKYIAANTPNNGLVFFNYMNKFNRNEQLLEKTLQLDYVYSRGDIRTRYLEDNDKKEKEYIIVSGPGLENMPYVDEAAIESSEKVVQTVRLETKSNYIILPNPPSVIKQLLKNAPLFLKGERNLLDGMYANYYLEDWWKIYYINSNM